MHRKRVTLLATALGLAVSMCGLALMIGQNQAHHIQAAPSAPNDVVVSINDFYFDPPELTVSLGTTVVWQNQGSVTHTISITGVVSSGDIGPSEIFTHTFNSKGTFAYQCAHHLDMQASVTVVDAQDVPVDVWVSAWHDQVVSAGAGIDYHVEYANSTSFDAQNAALTVTLPSASTLVTSTKSGEYFPPSSRSGRVLVYDIGTLATYDSGVVDLFVALTNTLKVNDPVVLAASISAVNPDPYPDNNYAEDR